MGIHWAGMNAMEEFHLLMKPEDVECTGSAAQSGEWLPIGTNVEYLANAYFLINSTK
ncbi:MAG: hypothetical protein ACLT16_20175 [[Clostridium] innocuum]